MTRLWMWAVTVALLPPIASLYLAHGAGVLLQVLLAVVVCLLCEWFCLASKKQPIMPSLTDGSAIVAGIIIGLSLPSLAAWYVAAAAAAFAMLLGKHAYGGLGNNPFNPAMAGYALAFVSFPAEFSAANYSSNELNTLHSAWANIFSGVQADAISTPTPLLAARLNIESPPALWLVPLSCIAGGCLLLILRIADWRLPLSFIIGASIFSGDMQNANNINIDALAYGGLMFAAFFVITDPVTAANSRGGRWIYGLAAGALTALLRQYGAHADGIAFAILICNMLAPLADKTAAAFATLPTWITRRWK